jgi:hypothetical protein
MAGFATHEDFGRKHAEKGPTEKSFGLVFAGFFLLVSLAPLRRHAPVRWWALAVSFLFLLLAFTTPRVLRPLNKLWMQLGRLLGRVTTPIVTALLFFLIFTPAGFVSRMLGKDPLRLSFDRSARTYWRERQPPGPPPQGMSDQF